MYKLFFKKITTLILIGTIFFSGFDGQEVFLFVKDIFNYNNIKNIGDISLVSQGKNILNKLINGTANAEAAVNPSEREYLITIGPAPGSTSANYVFASVFNPSGSGRTMVIKRIVIRSDNGSASASSYVDLSLRRITAASAGTQIAVTDIPKKNASSTNSIADIRSDGVTVTFAGTTDSRIFGQPQAGAVGSYFSNREIVFDTNDEKYVLQPGEGIALYQEAGGDLDSRVRLFVEWDEQTVAPTARNEFLFAFPRVENAARSNYVYNSFFNPVSSGKTAIVKRIWFGSETCDANARYTNNVVMRRITSASVGTAVSAADVPKKNTSSADSVMDFRYDNVTVTEVGGVDARLIHITPCGLAGQAHGWQEINFQSNDEKVILQEGEGLSLASLATGDPDQLIRMIVEWEEVPVASTPASQGEYMWASDKVTSASAVNTTRFSFFNPTGSGKVIVIKRLVIKNDADTTGNYAIYNFRRITAASGGLLMTASDLPKKHSGTANSALEVRWCDTTCGTAMSATYAGTADSALLSAIGPGNVGQTIGHKQIFFGDNEKIVLQEGEGIGFYNDVLTSDVDQYVKVLIEWKEQASAPSSQGEYLIDVGPVNGSTATSYNYVTFFNPSASGKTAIIKRMNIRVDAANAAVYIPMQLRRITAASAGTQITAPNIPKKHSGTANSAMEIRRTGVTATYAGTTDSKLLAIQTPGAVASAISGNTGYKELIFKNDEYIVLQPGEGVGFYHDTSAGDVDFRVNVLFEWQEVATASTPSSGGEFLMSTGPINQSLNANYVYSTFFNPVSSAKKYIVKRFGILATRSGTASAPSYTTATIRKITAASAGTLIATSSFPKKHSGTGSATAEIRTTGVTATFSGATESRLSGVQIPGVVNQVFGLFDSEVYLGDEMILKPGEGIALYQEAVTGDANVRYRFLFDWSEVDAADPPKTISFSISKNTIYFGQASSVITRYGSSTNSSGSDTEVEAHNISVMTNADSGYTVTVRGDTLNKGVVPLSATNTIDAIGSTSTSSFVGVEQFGLRAVASGGIGTVYSPYASAGFAYGSTGIATSLVFGASVGDSATTTYSVRYLVNLSSLTESGSYVADLVYIATANF